MAMAWVKGLRKSCKKLFKNPEAARHFSACRNSCFEKLRKASRERCKLQLKKIHHWVILDKCTEISKGSLEVYPGLLHTCKISTLQQELTGSSLNYCFTALHFTCLQESWIRLCRILENTSVIKQKGESQNGG